MGILITFLVGIVTGIIATMIVSGIKLLIYYKKVRKSNLSGEWEQKIYDLTTNECMKTDIYNMKFVDYKDSGLLHINVTGTIKRVQPLTQGHRRWQFKGYLEGDVLTILYQSQRGVKSRGCIYARLVDDFKFEGIYLEEHIDGKIDSTHLVLTKKL